MVDHYKLERALFQLIRDEHGSDAVKPRPTRFSADTGTMFDGPTDYLQGAVVAIKAAGVAKNFAREWALGARGEVGSWRAVAEILGKYIPDEYDDPAMSAFIWAAPRPSMRHDPISASWRCEACRQRITDHGPYGGHPDEEETGHAEGCSRHYQDVQAWAERTGWDDDEG